MYIKGIAWYIKSIANAALCHIRFQEHITCKEPACSLPG